MAGNRRVCVVCSAELAVEACHLARTLAGDGAAVTLLLAGDGAIADEDGLNNVQAVSLPPTPVPLAPCAEVTALSWRCRDWLAGQDFDLVLFPDRGGFAYYTLLARRQRLDLSATAVAVLGWGPSLWRAEADGRLVDEFDLVVADYQERRSVEMADALVVPHDGVAAWMRKAGWTLPGQVIEQALPSRLAPRPASAAAVEEIVYVGGLSRQDGLLLFCAAVERLAPLLAERGILVRLLGPARPHPDFDALSHLAERSAGWPFRHLVDAEALAPEVLADRLGPGRLAVLPAVARGEPLTLRDCLALGGPVLAVDAPGVRELLPESHLAAPTPPALAAALAAAIEAPPPPAAVPAAEGWSALAERLCRLAALAPAQPLSPTLVSVCLTHFNRPQLLERAVASVLAQSWPHLQIIVVDDGSTDPAALASVDDLERQWGEAVTVIRQPNRYLGAARNRAAAEARGEFLLFMDDDNVAMPDEIETMLRAATETAADVLTTVINVFTDDDALARGEPPSALWVPLGGCAAGGLYSNVFGDANALIRRGAFERVGGFSEAFGLGLEDWELFAKLALAGLRFDVVAKPLLWYRQSPGGMLLASVNRPAELRRAATGYLAAAPAALAPALLLAQGVHYRQQLYRREYRAAAALADERLAAMAGMEAMVAERDRIIAGQAALLDERWTAMREMSRVLDERLRAMEEMGRAIYDREQANTALAEAVAERDRVIGQQAARLERLFKTRSYRALRKLGLFKE